MFKCEKCIFYDENGFRDMNVHIPECRFILTEEIRKRDNNEKYDLFDALIYDTSIAEECKYFTYLSEIVDLIKKEKGGLL